MVDRQFSDARLAALYDVFCSLDRRDDLDFYLALVRSADAVLDVGCGTGMLLHRARSAGHRGRLCGLDPAPGMLQHARVRTDVEWTLGDLSTFTSTEPFDLIVMTGHAFQTLVDDDELRAALTTIRSLLTDGGRFAFETRNPLVRAWERWTPAHPEECTDASGAAVRMEHEVETQVAGDVVRFTTTFTHPSWDRPERSRSTLRFLAPASLTAFLNHAGLPIVEQFGDWNRSPLTDTSPEIITIARRP